MKYIFLGSLVTYFYKEKHLIVFLKCRKGQAEKKFLFTQKIESPAGFSHFSTIVHFLDLYVPTHAGVVKFVSTHY